jgi:two-component system nitrogen regulation response regulator GlnG/two-component system response regulator HydG
VTSEPLVDALAVVFCAGEPTRVGEVVLLAPAAEKRSYVLGRGDGSDAGRRERARFVRQRPGENEQTPPLQSARISREQLVLRSHPEGGVVVENVGKRALLIGGEETREGRVRPGDVLEIGSQMVLLAVQRPATMRPLRSVAPRLPPAFGEADAYGFVGESPAAWRLRDEVAMVAKRSEHVIVLGESGTGKELVAQAIHALSPRAGRKLVVRNAATVPSGILDAELFGNTANYPNAGMPERPGLVGEADGSTLFLDEIGELPTELQTHLLRLLDSGDYQRLGDARRRTADLRVVAATNRPLGQLKSDVAARFALRIHVPGLQHRREDVPLLARHLLGTIEAGAHPTNAVRLSRELVLGLVTHHHVTHVREIKNILFRSMVESHGEELGLTPGVREMLGLGDDESPPSVRDVPREVIVEALARHGGVREKVWRELGMPNRYLLKRLMKRYGIADDDPKE